ncbi:MAG: hypothetical protein ACR2KF_07245 [Nitrososphaeraceae archaeon]
MYEITPDKTRTIHKFSNDTSFTDRLLDIAQREEERQEESVPFINLLERGQRKKKEPTVQDLRKELGLE